MLLQEYLNKVNMTVADFAAVVNVHHDAVRKWTRGQRIPRRKQMQAIERATNGAVKAADFYPADAGQAA